MGDFNARIGWLHSIYPQCIGKHNIGQHNKRGERLASFCMAKNFYITNTFLDKRRIHKWNHPNGRSKGRIDFILSRSKFRQNVTDASVLNTPSISDHRLVRADVKVDYVWQKPKPATKRFNIPALKNHETASSFQLELSNRFLPLLDAFPSDVQELSDAVSNHITETAEKVLPPLKSPKPTWNASGHDKSNSCEKSCP